MCTRAYRNTRVHPRDVSYLIIVRGELVEELFNPPLLSWTVDVGNLVLGQTGEVQLHLDAKGETERNTEVTQVNTF